MQIGNNQKKKFKTINLQKTKTMLSKQKLKNLSNNLNWLVIRQLKELSKFKISNTKWKSLPNEEKDRIKSEQKINNEFLKRNGQIILSDIIIAKEGEKRYRTNDTEFVYSEDKRKLVNIKNPKIEEVSYQRAQDKTYNVAFEQEMDVESKQYEYQTKWYDGTNFLEWYNKPIEQRYKQGTFRRPGDKLHILDENNLSY